MSRRKSYNKQSPVNSAGMSTSLRYNTDAASLFRCARHGLLNTQMTSSPASDEAEFKVACLCNLSYACMKLGSMDEAEEACCQALRMRPANAKALFRRGQARLALERTVEATSDFSEVCLLEPNNAEATKMLRRAQGDEDPRPPPVGISPHERDTGKSKAAVPPEKSNAAVPPARRRKEALVREATTGNSSPNDAVVNVKPEQTEAGGNAGNTKQNRVEASDASSAPLSGQSFMVSGWLNSAERKQAGQLLGNNDNRRRLDDTADRDRSSVARPGDAEGTVSVSRLVSQLSRTQKVASKNAPEEPVTSGTAATAVQAEWSRLQVEEDIRVQESLRRLPAGGGPHAREKAAKQAVVKGKLVDAKGGTLTEKTTTKKIKRKAVHGGGSKVVNQTSSLEWASLEEEETSVREAFRAKLGVGGKPPSKEKVKEKKSVKKNKFKENKD